MPIDCINRYLLMQVLLVSATFLECRPCFEWLDLNPQWPVDRLISGVGQMAAAVALQKKLFVRRPDLIIQAGIAGAADAGDIGQVFVVGSEIIADLGATETAGFRDLFDLHLADPDQPPFHSGKLANPWREWLDFTALDTRPGITVNQIVTDKQLLDERKQNHPSFVESMEGAALHYVALGENIPFLQIRAVSNEAGVRDKTRWQLKESIAVLNRTLQTLIFKLVTADEIYPGIQPMP